MFYIYSLFNYLLLTLVIVCTKCEHNDNDLQSNDILQSPDEQQANFAKQQFNQFIVKYGKKYANDDRERQRRFAIFERNLMKIKLLNDNERGSAEYGITQFADLSPSEFRHYFTGFRPQLSVRSSKYARKISLNDLPTDPLPKSFDWRSSPMGVVSAVKNQGMCGSCWAFSTTGNVEGIWALRYNQSISLSEQDLVDCDTLDQGCNGGLPTNAYKTIIEMGGIENENDYPYEARDEKCHFNKSLSRATIDSYVVLPTNETILAQWLFKNGPISIGINANAMQFYFGGISHPLKWLCNPKNLDHGVLIVGFGIGKTRILKRLEPFWIIKNSWGNSWGEKGYYRVYRGDGTCGLNLMASSAWIN